MQRWPVEKIMWNKKDQSYSHSKLNSNCAPLTTSQSDTHSEHPTVLLMSHYRTSFLKCHITNWQTAQPLGLTKRDFKSPESKTSHQRVQIKHWGRREKEKWGKKKKNNQTLWLLIMLMTWQGIWESVWLDTPSLGSEGNNREMKNTAMLLCGKNSTVEKYSGWSSKAKVITLTEEI